MKRSSLALRFILVVLLILMIGQGLLWMWFMYVQRGRYEDMIRNKIVTLSALLADVSANAIATYDYTQIDDYIKTIGVDEDILSIRLMDNDGKVLREASLKKEEGMSRINPLYVPSVSRYKAPIKKYDEPLGTVEISYSGRRINENIKWLVTIPPIGQSAVFILVILAIYRIFQRSIGRPIERLNSWISKVTAGDLTVGMEAQGGDEIGSIGKGLKFLVERLVMTVSKLNSTADNVVMAIRQLEMTFGNARKGMQRQSNALDEMTESLKKANESQRKITESTDRMSEFSSENVTSLLEMRSASDEIVSNTNRLFNAVENSYSVVSETSQTAKSISESAREVLSSVEETSASVEEISASVKEIERSAKDSTKLAESVRTIAAEKGILAVADTIEGMERISDKVKYSVEVVTRLGARSKDIEKMLSVIKDVTEQTNLLSLNAAILAVQAGEFGKGFSVVAEEIRALSDRTAVSTKEIAGIVNTIQKEIADVVVSIEDGMQLVEEGSGMVYLAGENIALVVEEAQKSSRMARAIEKATEEQAKGLVQIRSAVDNISNMISQVAKATEEQVKGSGYMLEKLTEVRDATDSTKKGTAEQAQGVKLITKNIELAAEKTGEINKAAMSQQETNDGIVHAIEQIKNIGITALTDVEDVALSLKTLHAEIETLRKEMAAFRVR
jgi:methyl-accepting chemotaxis protein